MLHPVFVKFKKHSKNFYLSKKDKNEVDILSNIVYNTER